MENTYKLTQMEVNAIRGWARKVDDARAALELAQSEFAMIQNTIASRCPSPVEGMDLERGVFVMMAPEPPAPSKEK